ncbi:SGNH/GDSL hydrolase family protein [Bradyrhizobium sp. LB11.1]|uniref:SGNH/GDSL hydrolase family protein n=1 Tax=Bradyrhizobium sp. LB11.1 TaxID=3156326 RepID=UPI003391B0C3
MDRRAFLQGLGLVAASAGTTYWFTRPKVRAPKGVYVQMGSSITAGLHSPGSYLTPVIVGSRLNLTPINVGFDGACAGAYERPNADEFSLCKLVDAITSGDWSAQEGAMPYLGNGNEAALSRIKTVDFSKVTHIGMEYGTNDFTVCAPVEAFKASLSYSVNKLLTAFPKARLFLMTPAWRLNFEELDSDTHPDERGIFLREYVDGMIDVARSTGVPCLDMWRTLGINATNYKSFTLDGTHPNETGARIRGEIIASFISSEFGS